MRVIQLPIQTLQGYDWKNKTIIPNQQHFYVSGGRKVKDKIEENIVLKRAPRPIVTTKMSGSERTHKNTTPAHQEESMV